MLRLRFPARVACACLLLAAFALAAKHPLTMDDALTIKRAAGAVLSPDGNWVVYTVTQWDPVSKDPAKPGKMEQHSHLWRVSAKDPTGEGAPHQITFGEKGESLPAFSPDGKLISFIAQRGTAAAGGGPGADSGPKPQLYLMRTDGGEAWQLTESKEAVSDYAWSPDSSQIAFTTRQPLPKEMEERRQRGDDPQVFEGDFRMTGISVIKLAGKKAQTMDVGHDVTVEGPPSWSPDGRRFVFAAKPTPMIRDYRSQVYIATVGIGVEKITDNNGPNQSPAWSPDGKKIAFLNTRTGADNGDGIPLLDISNIHLRIYDVESRRTDDVANASFDLSAGAPVWVDPSHIIFRTGHRAYGDVFEFDLGSRQYRALTDKQIINLSGKDALSANGSEIVFTRSSTAAPADVYIAGLNFSRPRKLTETNPQIAEFELGTEEPITWKSPDGQEVEGMLLKPVNYEPGKKYPLLTRVHGGPTDAFFADFSGEAQFWAGKGWAVLFPNPRGSTNYGEKFMRANIGDWGGGDYKDIMAGVDAVVARGVADPDRLAEWGWSYGGYMTCWIVTQTSRFKAAMMGAGLSDLPSMYGTTDIPGYIATFFKGDLNKATLNVYAQHSGLTYVDNVKTPLLILQGAQDDRVPTSQSMEFYRALKDRGRTTELVYYPREGHGFREYYHQYDRMKRTYDWIMKYTLGGAGSGQHTAAGGPE